MQSQAKQWMVLLTKSAATISKRPSLLKSPTATPYGVLVDPTENALACVWKFPIPSPYNTLTVLSHNIGSYNIKIAIPNEIAHCNALRSKPHRESSLLEASWSIPNQHTQGIVAFIGSHKSSLPSLLKKPTATAGGFNPTLNVVALSGNSPFRPQTARSLYCHQIRSYNIEMDQARIITNKN